MNEAETSPADSAVSTADVGGCLGGSSRNTGSQMDHRRAQAEADRGRGRRQLQYSFDVDHSAADIAAPGATSRAVPAPTNGCARPGVWSLIRHHGGLTFGVLRDRSGTDPALRRPGRAR